MDDKSIKNNKKDEVNIQIIDKINELELEIKKINITEPNEPKSRNLSKRKLIINLDTIVYDIFGTGENKGRNYDKISAEIKKIENKNELEKAKLKKKINQISKRISDKEIKVNLNEEEKENEIVQNKLNLQNKKIMMLELERDKKLNFIEVIQKLKIPPEKRKIRDILRIKRYIEQSNLGKNLIEEFSDITIIDKLINFCSIEMRYEKYEKGNTIYKVGEHPNSFYSIIFGKVNILKPIEKHELLTGFQYFNYLMNLRKKKEQYIFNLCIKNNTVNYFIEQNDVDIIHYIYLINYLEYIKSKNDVELELHKILDLIDIKPEELGIDQSKINSNAYINSNIKSIKKRIPVISDIALQKYSFITNYLIKKDAIIYEYNKILTLKGNDYFGDNDIENHTTRNTLAIAEQDTEVAYLPNKLYYTQIALLKSIILEKKISNLHSSYFFNKIKYNKFSKKYYKLFINERYVKGDILFNEGTQINYLYFIQEGNVQLYSSKSMNEIQQLINLLIEKKSENKDIQTDNYYSYNKVNSKQDDLVNYLNLKQNNKLIILNNNEDIGAVSYFLGNDYLVSCKIISNYAKIFKIDVNYINNMLKNEIDCNEEFLKRMKKKIELLSERLFKINNIKLIMTDEKINKEKLDIKIVEEKKTLILNSSINKILISYNKINNLVTENINKNNNNNKLDKLEKQDTKKNNLDLPILCSNRKINLNNSFLNTHKNELNDSNLFKKIMTRKKKLIFEDNIIKTISKDFKSFIQNKYTLTKLNKSNKNIKDPKKKNELVNCNLNNSEEKAKVGEKETINNSNINNSSSSTQMVDKLEKKVKMPKILKYYIKSDIKSLSNDYKRINLINRFNEKMKNKKEKYNHPYYEQKTLFKMERYKIFDRSQRNKEYQNELLKTQIKRVRGLKNLHLTTMNNLY